MKYALASFFCCSALLADALCDPIEPPPEKTFGCAYSVAAYNCLDKTWSPNLTISADFLYTYANEEGLDLANSAGLVTGGVGGAVVVGTSNSQVLTQQFAYKPGFKVGFGVDYKEWTTACEYTWIRQNTTTNRSAIGPNIDSQSGVWFLNNWFQQTSSVGQTLSATHVNSQWHLAMDIADFKTGRSYYHAHHLMINPFAGLRAAWIRQKLNIGIEVPSATITDLTSAPVISHNSSNSWSLGPRFGFDSSVIFKGGFKLFSNATAALLFTQYTHVKHKEQMASSIANPTLLRTQLHNVNALRPELDLGLGLGWSSFVNGQKQHIDLSASYQFCLFWNQNMMRKLNDQTVSGIGASPGDLFLHGLDVRASFSF